MRQYMGQSHMVFSFALWFLSFQQLLYCPASLIAQLPPHRTIHFAYHERQSGIISLKNDHIVFD